MLDYSVSHSICVVSVAFNGLLTHTLLLQHPQLQVTFPDQQEDQSLLRPQPTLAWEWDPDPVAFPLPQGPRIQRLVPDQNRLSLCLTSFIPSLPLSLCTMCGYALSLAELIINMLTHDQSFPTSVFAHAHI